MDYITERITNIKELEDLIEKCYILAQAINKENPEIESSLMLVNTLKTASEFEFHIERRKTSYLD